MNQRQIFTLYPSVLLLGPLFALELWAQGPGLSPHDQRKAIVQRAGMQVLEPPRIALDFTLADLEGRETTLSEMQGRWVLLTFFASWCGPCATEMPSLQKLFMRFKDQGFVVLGVSSENNQTSLRTFLRNKGATFPVLLDNHGQTSRMYQASSIPMSFLIDPQGQLVALARGARDWMRAQSSISQLLQLQAPDPNASSSYNTTNQPVDLPDEFIAPSASLSLAQVKARAQHPFKLEVVIEWAGHFQDYLLHPPELQLPEGVTIIGTAAHTSSRQGRAKITYELSLIAQKAGSYSLDPLELRYTPRQESQPLSQRIQGPTVTVHPATLLGFEPATFWLGLALTLALSLLYPIYGFVRARKTAQDSAKTPSSAQGLEQLNAHLAKARQARIRGELRDVAQEILRFYGLIDPSLSPSDIAPWAEKIRFGGHTPTQPELDGILRDAQRVMHRLHPPTSMSQEPDIKLKSSQGEPI
jgi:peroxiredoxin